jgi:adenylylsulfate kinase
MIILMAGLPATGKTTIAQALARNLSGVVLGKDEIRSALFAPDDIEHSAAQDDFVQAMMLQTAAYLFAKDPNRVVILDGRTFSRNQQIRRVLEFAASVRQPWCVLECVCSEATARSRLERQQKEGSHPAANRDFALYSAVRDRFEEIPAPKTVLDTDQPHEFCVRIALAALGR